MHNSLKLKESLTGIETDHLLQKLDSSKQSVQRLYVESRIYMYTYSVLKPTCNKKEERKLFFLNSLIELFKQLHFLKIALLRYDSHNIIHPFEVYITQWFGYITLLIFQIVKIHITKFAILTIFKCNFVAFITFTMLCNHHHYLFLKSFHHHTQKFCNHYAVTSHFPPPSPW